MLQYVNEDKIANNDGVNSWVLKVILDMSVQELEINEGIFANLEMRIIFFFKLAEKT